MSFSTADHRSNSSCSTSAVDTCTPGGRFSAWHIGVWEAAAGQQQARPPAAVSLHGRWGCGRAQPWGRHASGQDATGFRADSEWQVLLAATQGEAAPPEVKMRWMTASASSSRPFTTSQRGDSGSSQSVAAVRPGKASNTVGTAAQAAPACCPIKPAHSHPTRPQTSLRSSSTHSRGAIATTPSKHTHCTCKNGGRDDGRTDH